MAPAAGIGLAIEERLFSSTHPPRVVVVEVIAGSEAARQGVQEGDEVQSVDGMSVAGMRLSEVKILMAGSSHEGAKGVLALQVRRGSSILTLQLARRNPPRWTRAVKGGPYERCPDDTALLVAVAVCVVS
ncbi:hypothetical protein T484DRAFT_1932221 [Baffinella frigidus]|nr:hypothetical protein T484DRAFT_1932221 [Cryptophyta sp. CCMP2293]